MRLAQRIGETTLRIEQRYRYDSWQVRASSIDVRVLFDLGRHVIAGPHRRFHAHTGATFQQRVYHATIAPQVAVPVFRTTDRELSPLVSVTGGRAVWCASPTGRRRPAWSASSTAQRTRRMGSQWWIGAAARTTATGSGRAGSACTDRRARAGAHQRVRRELAPHTVEGAYALTFLSKPLQREPHRGGTSLRRDEPAERCLRSWLLGAADATDAPAPYRSPDVKPTANPIE